MSLLKAIKYELSSKQYKTTLRAINKARRYMRTLS